MHNIFFLFMRDYQYGNVNSFCIGISICSVCPNPFQHPSIKKSGLQFHTVFVWYPHLFRMPLRPESSRFKQLFILLKGFKFTQMSDYLSVWLSSYTLQRWNMSNHRTVTANVGWKIGFTPEPRHPSLFLYRYSTRKIRDPGRWKVKSTAVEFGRLVGWLVGWADKRKSFFAAPHGSCERLPDPSPALHRRAVVRWQFDIWLGTRNRTNHSWVGSGEKFRQKLETKT